MNPWRSPFLPWPVALAVIVIALAFGVWGWPE
jgi:hypothetical protein